MKFSRSSRADIVGLVSPSLFTNPRQSQDAQIYVYEAEILIGPQIITGHNFASDDYISSLRSYLHSDTGHSPLSNQFATENVRKTSILVSSGVAFPYLLK